MVYHWVLGGSLLNHDSFFLSNLTAHPRLVVAGHLPVGSQHSPSEVPLKQR